MKRMAFLMGLLFCLQGSAHAYTYVPEGHVIEGMGNFARSLTAWVEDTKTLEVKQVYIGATQTSKGVPYKARFTLPVVPANLAIVARVAIQAGLMVGSSYLIPWLADQALNWYFDETTNEIKVPGQGTTTTENPLGVATFSGPNMGQTGVCYASQWRHYNLVSGPGCPAGSSQVSNLCTAGSIHQALGWCTGTYNNLPTCSYVPTVAATSRCDGGCCTTQPRTYTYIILSANLLSQSSEITGEGVAVPWGTVDDALEADFLSNRQNGYELARDAMAAVGPGVATQNQGWPQSGPDAPGNGLSPEQGAAVQTALNDSVTADVKASLDTAAADNPDDPYGGWDDWEYSPNEIATAIETKLKPYLEPGEVTVDAEGDPPDKDSLPDVLDDFHDGVSSWQGLTLLNSLTLETNSANCNFCIDKPEILGLSGQVCYDCCPHESMLAGLGNILFGIMALCWLFWIFM